VSRAGVGGCERPIARDRAGHARRSHVGRDSMARRSRSQRLLDSFCQRAIWPLSDDEPS
jgi:hypothetical protein